MIWTDSMYEIGNPMAILVVILINILFIDEMSWSFWSYSTIFDRDFVIQVKSERVKGWRIWRMWGISYNAYQKWQSLINVFPITYFRENFHRAHSASQQTYQCCYWTEPFHRYILSFHPIALEESSCCKFPNPRYLFQISAYICADHKPKYHPPSSLDQKEQPVRLRPTSWIKIFHFGWIFIIFFLIFINFLFNLTLDNNR